HLARQASVAANRRPLAHERGLRSATSASPVGAMPRQLPTDTPASAAWRRELFSSREPKAAVIRGPLTSRTSEAMAACWQQGYESWTSSSPMKSSFRTISATISIALYDPLRAAADRNDRAMSWIIRQAL